MVEDICMVDWDDSGLYGFNGQDQLLTKAAGLLICIENETLIYNAQDKPDQKV